MRVDRPSATGLIGSLRELGGGLMASVQDRVELFSIEFGGEKYRFLRTVVWGAATLFSGAMALIFASVTLVYLFWESARLAVLIALTVSYAVALLVTYLILRRHLAGQPRPFAATLDELRHDRACLRTRI